MDFFGSFNYPPNPNRCRPSDGLSSTPLVVVVVTSLLCYVIAMYYGLRDGFKVADLGDHLAAYGTVVLLLVNFSYIYHTLKILFCVKSYSFPTWQEVRELRNTVMSLTSSFVIGLGLVIVAFSWFTEFGHIRDPAPVPIKTDNGSTRSIPSEFNVNETLTWTESSLQNDTLTWTESSLQNDTLTWTESSLQNDTLALNESTLRNNDDSVANRNHLLTKDIKKVWLDHFQPLDSAVVPRNKTGSNFHPVESVVVSRNTTNGSFQPIDSVVVPRNTTKDRKILLNETESEHHEDDHRSHTRDNPPFVSLFFSSFSFCLAGAMIIITTIFERKCVDALQEEQVNNGGASDYLPSGETDRLPLHPVTSRRLVPCDGDGVHKDFLVLGGRDSGMVSYDRSNVTRASEDETNVASTSTSSTRLFYQESTFSAHDSDQSDSAAGKRVHFDEPQSSTVMLYPQYSPGMGHYWCSVCNSILAPLPRSQEHHSGAIPKTRRKKKSADVNIEEIKGIAQTLLQAQTSMGNRRLDVDPQERILDPANKKAKRKSKPGAENTEVLPQDKPSQSSSENLAAELFHSVENVPEGECIEMKRK